ncbi:MAG TPA: ThiF family adenylyltransferase [Vicinamibacteria bacterium]|nr:ThiF family adenylyltransferase [Vicinamibacteria bacterium]
MSDLRAFQTAVLSPSFPPDESFRPFLFTLQEDEHEILTAFCRERGLRLIDRMEWQDATGDRGASSGNWIYLPWERKVVHLLGPEAFFATITDRNADKITQGEQQLLRTKRVAVIGLSVGAEAAVTVAREHLCGEIVLADFDRLELSNLNRIEAGFDELGENKCRIAARRIAKVNPYLGITLFEEGVTEENLGAFLNGVDLVIEECDRLSVKLLVRRFCRDHGINLVFAADERGFLSVEPYGVYPDLLPFHGRISEIQPPREAFDTPLAYMKELTRWMGGWEAISERSRKSLEQLGTTLSGYPQLASEARLAAGQVGHVARRLLLGERVRPFIGNLDLEELLPG